MAVLVGAGEVLLPGWIADFVAQITVYRHYAGASMLELLYVRALGLGFAALFVFGLLILMSRRRAAPNFVPMLAFVLAMEVFIVPGLKSLFNLSPAHSGALHPAIKISGRVSFNFVPIALASGVTQVGWKRFRSCNHPPQSVCTAIHRCAPIYWQVSEAVPLTVVDVF